MRVKLSWRGAAFLDRGSNRFGMAGCRWADGARRSSNTQEQAREGLGAMRMCGHRDEENWGCCRGQLVQVNDIWHGAMTEAHGTYI